MNKTARAILITISAVLVFVTLYFYLCMVFMPKDINDLGGKKYYNAMGYKAEDKHTIDMVFCGNSDVYSGFSPLEFYRQTGVTSYVCSAGQQSMKSVENNIKYMAKNQNIKYVLLDVDCFFTTNTIFRGTGVYDLAPFTALFKYHARFKELELGDFIHRPKVKKDNLKGFIPSDTICSYTLRPDYMQDVLAKPVKIAKSVEKSLKNVKKLCEKYKMDIILWCLPTPKSWNNAKNIAVSNLAKKLELEYIDLNLPTEGFDFDFENSFRDEGNHMNIWGANYTTKFIAEFLSKRYNFVDHRAQAGYEEWDSLAENYENLVKDYIAKGSNL